MGQGSRNNGSDGIKQNDGEKMKFKTETLMTIICTVIATCVAILVGHYVYTVFQSVATKIGNIPG